MNKKTVALVAGILLAYIAIAKVFLPHIVAPALLTVPDYPRTVNGSHTAATPQQFGSVVQVTTFDTTDSPDTVRTYYKQRLLGVRPFVSRRGVVMPLHWGWQVADRADGAYFSWECAKYAEVRTHPAATGIVRVEIREATDPCY